jgi:primosomal protein N' (replication factor Y)
VPVSACYASVVVDLAVDPVKDRLFTYRIPDYLAQDVVPGVSVLVPFGRQQTIAGYVVSCSDNLPQFFVDRQIQVKEVMAVLDPELFFDKEYIDFLQWAADYYCSGLIDVISAAIPSSLAPRLKQKIRLRDSLQPENSKLMPHETAFIEILKEAKKAELALSTLKQRWCRLTKNKDSQFYRVLNILLNVGLIERNTSVTGTNKIKKVNKSDWRDPLKYLHDKKQIEAEQLALTEDQSRVFSRLSKALSETLELSGVDTKSAQDQTIPWLLHGVTGSGKTEIYLRLVEQALNSNRTALLMVPEIALTPQLAQRLVEKFGKQVAVWHSGLSDGEHYDTWKRLQNGELKILLGARSAVLVNLPKLGVIIIDEEHDASYKQSNSPRYNAKTLALEKARRYGALIVYGSATPDISTYYNAAKEERILSLPKRIFNQDFPKIILVDMRNEFADGNRSVFSKTLFSALSKCLERKEQAILLINRRGYASHVFCRACGHVSTCKNCSVAMVYHRHSLMSDNGKETGRLVCHHCGYQENAVSTCPACQGPFLKHYGLGTQKVEMDLRKLLPEAKILRLDSDTTQRKGSTENIFEQFASGESDVLIGTQMVAKGLDNRKVTLVGILAADAAFNLPDYRSSERGFQLLTQVAGRTGRGKLPGVVVVQTFNPDLPTLKVSLSHDFAHFYAGELEARKTFLYPPFGQLIRIVIVCDQPELAQMTGEKIAESLSNYLADLLPLSSISMLGPAPCVLERLHGKYRQHLIVKNQAGKKGQDLISSFFKNRNFGETVQVAVDVDAIDLL